MIHKLIVLTMLFLVQACSKSDLKVVEKAVLANLPPTKTESIKATKEALQKGVFQGVQSLGKTNGFWNSALRLSAPPELQEAMSFARKAGLNTFVNSFEKSLNTAAEEATKSSLKIFKDAIVSMSINDVVKILTGPNDSATKYFQQKSQTRLLQTFKPIVSKAIKNNDVAKIYNELVVPLAPLAAVANVKIPTVSLETYVAEEASKAIFVKIAEAESQIRKNPAKRTTKLLRKVFGHYDSKKRRGSS